jgi:protein phosphatase/serine/threonine-protein phosphatase Stp1
MRSHIAGDDAAMAGPEGVMAELTFRSFARTHPGTRRRLNEDSYADRAEAGIWAVADGVGGADAGEVASAAVCAALMAIPAGLPAERMLAGLCQGLQAVHDDLQAMAAAREPPGLIASTVVVLTVTGPSFTCLWAGDSRAYLLRSGVLRRLTRDHSLVQELVDTGMITEAEAAYHPRANVITRAVGAGEAVLELDRVTGTLQPDDRFLLCSDGLTKAVDEADLADLLGAPEGMPAADLLVRAALAHQASDNVTAVTVEVRGVG